MASYEISAGELTVETVHRSDTGFATCDGKGGSNHDAVAVLGDLSLLYLADNEYLLTLGAPDTRMGASTLAGECVSKFDGKKFKFEPVVKQRNPNLIWILDRTGPYRYGVHGEISPAIAAPGRKMITAKWDFADPAPNR